MLEQQGYVGLTCQDLKYPTAEYVLSQCKALAFWTGLGEVPGFSSSGEVLGLHKAHNMRRTAPMNPPYNILLLLLWISPELKKCHRHD